MEVTDRPADFVSASEILFVSLSQLDEGVLASFSDEYVVLDAEEDCSAVLRSKVLSGCVELADRLADFAFGSGDSCVSVSQLDEGVSASFIDD